MQLPRELIGESVATTAIEGNCAKCSTAISIDPQTVALAMTWNRILEQTAAINRTNAALCDECYRSWQRELSERSRAISDRASKALSAARNGRALDPQTTTWLRANGYGKRLDRAIEASKHRKSRIPEI